MASELLIGVGPGEWRAAWLEDGVAVELYVERGDTCPVGSLHLGRVVRRVAGLDATLVDIGEERPGFLPLRPRGADAPRLDEGARVMVRVSREAQRGKGARLSTQLSLRGEADAVDIAERAAGLDPPAQLDPAPGFAAALALRLPGVPERVLADDAAVLRELRDAFPAGEIAHRAAADWPIDLDTLFESALAPTLALPGGGAIHFEDCRAALLIDVDTGTPDSGSAGRAALAVNLAAATVIARQLRLRQLGGGIVIDFAALDGRGPRERVRQAVATAIAGDPAVPLVLGWTRLGHLEIVRPRRGRPLGDAMLEPSGMRKSATALAFDALRALYREARARPAANWRLVVSPGIAAALRGSAAKGLRALEARLGRSVMIDVAPGHDADAFDIVAR